MLFFDQLELLGNLLRRNRCAYIDAANSLGAGPTGAYRCSRRSVCVGELRCRYSICLGWMRQQQSPLFLSFHPFPQHHMTRRTSIMAIGEVRPIVKDHVRRVPMDEWKKP